MALENANVLIELQERKTELEKNMQELNVQMQNTSNTLLRVAGAVEVLEQIEASKSVEEVVDEVVDEDVEEDA
jgi:Ni,Fe-hydrogenase I large subunit